jgi:hypothetical protein
MTILMIILSALLMLGNPAVGSMQEPTSKSDRIYQEIPDQQREPLKKALEKLVAAQQKRDWEAIWELYNRPTGETKDSFLKKMKPRRALRQFHVSKITFYPPEGSWIIEGCACFEGDAEDKGLWAGVHARWRESRWYLSPVVIGLPEGNEKGMRTRECTIQRSKPGSSTAPSTRPVTAG